MAQINKIKVDETTYDLVGLNQITTTSVASLPDTITDNTYYILTSDVAANIDLSAALSGSDVVEATKQGIMIKFKVADSATNGIIITLPSNVLIYGHSSSQKVAYPGMTYIATLLLGQWHLALLSEQTTETATTAEEE